VYRVAHPVQILPSEKRLRDSFDELYNRVMSDMHIRSAILGNLDFQDSGNRIRLVGAILVSDATEAVENRGNAAACGSRQERPFDKFMQSPCALQLERTLLDPTPHFALS